MPVRRHRLWIRFVAALVVLAVAWIAWEGWRWPDVTTVARRNPTTTAFMERYRARERAAGRTPRVAFTWVGYAAISPSLKRAVVVAEDIGFFSHHGFATAEITATVRRAIEEAELPKKGASTISQQLAKNLWLSPSRNPVRKAKEAILTWQLERAMGKRRILELYLNVAEFGPGVYGAEAASRRYFGKSAAELNDDEAAQLAAALPRPRAWHPGATGAGYQRYVESIKRRTAKAEFVARLI